MFRSENTVPKISFASSCALNLVGLALAGPKSTGAVRFVEPVLVPEIGRGWEFEEAESGRSLFLAHSRE